jgi:hypothetical protein
MFEPSGQKACLKGPSEEIPLKAMGTSDAICMLFFKIFQPTRHARLSRPRLGFEKLASASPRRRFDWITLLLGQGMDLKQSSKLTPITWGLPKCEPFSQSPYRQQTRCQPMVCSPRLRPPHIFGQGGTSFSRLYALFRCALS